MEGHPEICLSKVKEPHFYSSDLSNAIVTSKSDYDALFGAFGQQHRAVGEASTWYLASRQAVPNILIDHPDAHFIVMTRDPVQMARSLHHHNLRVLHENETDFATAWRLQGKRRAGQQIPKDCSEPMFLQYGESCSLGAHIDRLFGLVSPERVLHIPLEGLKTDPGRQYRRVLTFLGCRDDGRDSFPAENQARGMRSKLFQRFLRTGAQIRIQLGIHRGLGLGRLNERQSPKSDLDPAFEKELADYFAPDTSLLREALSQLPDEPVTPDR